MTKKDKHERVVKMQKLRHAVARLRNMRRTAPANAERQSWFARLLKRLGMTG